ncbi:MAG: diguanylate cyclase [Pseudomonadota bacterium]
MTATPFDPLFDALCPLHVMIDSDGRIDRVGPTLRKIFGDDPHLDLPFLGVFSVKRPQNITLPDQLLAASGQKLRLRFRNAPHLEMKGMILRGLPCGRALVNLSFGINVVRAVQEYGLTAADFAATDLTIEMLYLVEAKSAAMDASKQLNVRLQKARDTAEKQALTDALTGLSNRRAMEGMLDRLLRAQEPFALMHLDLDYFKAINDALGHAAGDFVLTEVAEILCNAVRTDDMVVRLGGDEFALILRQIVDREDVELVANRVIERLSMPMMFEGQECRISGSAGTTLSADYSQPDADTLLVDADLALYASKHAGRGRHLFFSKEMRADLPASRKG